ncbi:MAG: sigma-54 dependent transcriptional regulator [Candidatus Sulfotelmatobacter sp.]|jgi:transcriptional regulator with GAF, ATPase, and Fis domain
MTGKEQAHPNTTMVGTANGPANKEKAVSVQTLTMNSEIRPIVTQNAVMRTILRQVETIAKSDSSVLLLGETGVGKELFADFIHHSSVRAGKPHVKVELAALPHELLESELFGHDRGAFTGAFNSRKGLFELANGGTLFLDDIDDFPVQLQPKLLRAIEAREIFRLGGTASIRVDIRLIAATKVDLIDLVRCGSFRQDLYYRINEVPVEIPPLRQRRDDILLLASAFLGRFDANRTFLLAEDAQRVLLSYSWPGNVRELRNVMRRLAVLAEGEVHEQDLPPEIRSNTPLRFITQGCTQCLENEKLSFEEVVRCVERNLLEHAMRQAGSNRAKAARLLKMKSSTLRDKLKRYRLIA